MSTPKYTQDELMKKRANLIHQARELVTRVKEEDRDFNAEEKEQYDRIMADVHGFKERADREFNLAKLEKEVEEAAKAETRKAPEPDNQRSELIWTVKSTGVKDIRSTPEYEATFYRWLLTQDPTEHRALEAGVAGEGGALVPTPLSDAIVGIAEQSMSIYGLATKVQTDSGNFDLARVATSGTAAPGSNEETDISSLSTDPSFGTYSLSVNNRKASNYVVLSSELMSDSKFDLQAFIAQHGGNAIAEQDEIQYVSGGGTNGPTGFLSDATVGVTTSADFSYADLLALKYAVRAGWRRNGTWVMNDATISNVLALEDTGNTLIFRPGVAAGSDDNLAGNPVRTSFAMGNDAVGNKPVAFGDFSQYYIVEKPLSIARSDHVLFATDRVVFRLTRRRDGRLAQDDAVQVIHRTS